MPRRLTVEYQSPLALIPYQNNHKLHPPSQIKKIASAINRYGFDQPIVTDAAGVIIKGHGRREAALQLGLDKVPVIVASHLSQQEAAAARIADNILAELGQWDNLALEKELQSLTESLGDLNGLLDSTRLDNVLINLSEPKEIQEAISFTANAQYIGIVGSRTFPDESLIQDIVGKLPPNTVIISGGAKGVDSIAIAAAKSIGLETKEYLPDLTGCKHRSEYTKRYYQRNQQIIDDADVILAFTEKDNGGTWDSIKRARKANKPVKIFRPRNDDFEIALPTKKAIEREDKKGPYHIKNAGLGCFALTCRKNFQTEYIADFINAKDNNPHQCAEIMLPYFLDFFNQYRYGKIDLLTQPPQSIRHSDKPHCIDILSEMLSTELNIEYQKIFLPWDKKDRGRHAEHNNLKAMIDNSINLKNINIVFIIDDVITTGFTLHSSIETLHTTRIYARGLGFMHWN